MPELPEVETIVRDLRKKIINQRIADVLIFLPRAVQGDPDIFVRILKGNRFSDISRRGKLLIFSLAKGADKLLIHLKMTGQLVYCHQGRLIAGGHSQADFDRHLPNRHTRAGFVFADHARLYFNDLRTFGYLRLASGQELARELDKKFGPEPLSRQFNAIYLARAAKDRKISIKGLLLDQKIVAGIGNIYADEALHAAGIFPGRAAGRVNARQMEKLVAASKRILRQAIKYRGTTFNNYVDADGQRGHFYQHLKVYNRADQPCLACGHLLRKTRIAGRGTAYCPACQH